MPLLVRASRYRFSAEHTADIADDAGDSAHLQTTSTPPLFLTTVNVLCMDMIKLFVSALLLTCQRRSFKRYLFRYFKSNFYATFISKKRREFFICWHEIFPQMRIPNSLLARVCFVIIFRFLIDCNNALFGDPVETLKIWVPALIYSLQNNLYYVALTHLESTTYCVRIFLFSFLI